MNLDDPDLPLHLALAYILVKAFPNVPGAEGQTTPVYSTGFISSILTIVSREILEIADTPATYDTLRREVEPLVKRETDRKQRIKQKRRERGLAAGDDADDEDPEAYRWMEQFGASFEYVPEGCAFIDNLEKDIQERVNEADEEELTDTPEPFVHSKERRSPLGLFLRRIMLTLRKLSFTETSSLSRTLSKWCGHSAPGSSFYGISNRKYAMEDTLQTRITAMNKMRGSMNSGDYSGALDSLRRFYDYQFPSSHRGRHQHALLNLASFHYSTGGLPSAQEAIKEAIRVARAEGDRACLDHCMSLLHRIDAELDAPGPSTLKIEQRPIDDTRLPKVSTPMDELWVLQAALDLGEPLHIAQRRIHSALARHDSTSLKREDKQMQGWLTDHPFDEGAWHASQAALWGMTGSVTLAELHEDMALEVGGGDTSLVVLVARAERSAQRGAFDNAIGMLVEYQNVEGMSILSFKRWARCVWGILRHRAESSNDTSTLDLIDVLQPSPGSFRRKGHGGPLREDSEESADTSEPVHEQIKTALRKATKMTQSDTPPHLVLPHVLSATHLASELGLWPLYRLGTVIFGEVLLSMEGQKMAKKAIQEVEKIWPELVESGDEETISRAALVLGKSFVEVSMDEDDLALLDHAVEHLHRALSSAKKIQAKQTIDTAMELLALIAHLRHDSHSASVIQKEWEDINLVEEGHVLRDQVRSVAEFIKLVSARVSEGWSI